MSKEQEDSKPENVSWVVAPSLNIEWFKIIREGNGYRLRFDTGLVVVTIENETASGFDITVKAKEG